MANYYVKSSAAGANNGSSFTDAYTDIQSAATVAAAGDTVYVHNTHSQTNSSPGSYNFGTNRNNLVKVVSVNDSLVPTPGAQVRQFLETRGIAGACWCFGIDFSSTAYGAQFHGGTTDGLVIFQQCILGATTGNAGIAFFAYNSIRTEILLIDSTVRCAGTGFLGIGCGNLEMYGGSLVSGAAMVIGCGLAQGTPGKLIFEGVDLSALGSTATLCGSNSSTAGIADITISRCKLPTSWTGAASNSNNVRVEMYACDNAGTSLRNISYKASGQAFTESAIYRTAGAVEANIPMSWRLLSNTAATRLNPLASRPILRAWPGTAAESTAWVAGTSVTVNVEIVTDNITLTDNECWLEVTYFDTLGNPIGTRLSDFDSNFLSAGTNQTSSTVAWSTTGLTTPVKQKLSVTITPELRGYFTAVVKLGKPSTTVYVCPKIEVS